MVMSSVEMESAPAPMAAGKGAKVRGSRANGNDVYVDGIAVGGAKPKARKREGTADFDHADLAETDDNESNEDGFDDVAVRTNLNETVFFLPDLMTDEAGNFIIKFKMNEALTRWKFLGFAHTKDLKTGIITKEVVTQKDLMVMPNPPRFFREGDQIEFTAKVSNLTENRMEGTAMLQLFDAISNKPVNELLGIKNADLRSFKISPHSFQCTDAWCGRIYLLIQIRNKTTTYAQNTSIRKYIRINNSTIHLDTCMCLSHIKVRYTIMFAGIFIRNHQVLKISRSQLPFSLIVF